MPKPILNNPQTQQKTESILSATYQAPKQQAQQMDKFQLDRLLRRPRSKAYMEAMKKLDAGGRVHNKGKVDDIISAIRDEFPDVEMKGVLLGVVDICYLGVPYEVHTLGLEEQIIEHYKVGQPLPGLLEKARNLALRGGYLFIEVYVDCCRCIANNGMVAVIPH